MENTEKLVEVLRCNARTIRENNCVTFGDETLDSVADLIESLTAQLAESQRRERAAAENIPHNIITCKNHKPKKHEGKCSNGNGSCTYCENWEWRGPKEAGEGERE